MLFRRWLRATSRSLLLLLRRSENNRHWISQLHHVIHEHLDIIRSGDFEFHLAEKGDIGGVQRSVLQREFDFSFSQDGCLIGSDEPHCLGEAAKSRSPAVEEAEFQGNHRQLGHAQKVDNANQNEIARPAANSLTEWA